MGPAAASEVAAISKMTQPELDKYVALWKEKMKMAKDQAVGELEGMRIATAAKVKALQDTLKPLGVSVEAFKGAWAGAFGPIIEIFGQLAAKVVDVGTKVGEFFSKLAENNPTLSAIIFGFLALIPVLTLILSPLAVGIGLFGGIAAAMSAVWMLIGPVITGFAAMMGTVILVAAIIVGLVVAFKYLWNNVAWFRDGLTAAWDYIKKKTAETWAAIVKAITPAIQSVVAYVKQKLAEMQAFWNKYGSSIVALAKMHFNNIWLVIKGVMSYILGIFQAVWPIIAGAVKIAWNLIKLIIDTGIDYVMGIVKVGMALMQGDWKGAWTAIKETAQKIWKNIEQFFKNVDLKQIGKDIIKGLITGIGSMADAVKKTVKGIADNITGTVRKVLGIHSPSRVMMEVGKFVGAGLAKGITGSASQVEAAGKALASKLHAAIASKQTGSKQDAVLKNVQVYAKQQITVLTQIAKQREAIAIKLKAATDKLGEAIKMRSDFAKSVADNAMSFASIGSIEATTGEDLAKQLKHKLYAIIDFKKNIAKLQASGLDKAILQQLVEAGVEGGSEQAKLLANSGADVIKEINSVQGRINSVSQALGKNTADQFYSAGVMAAQGIAKGLESQAKALEASANKISEALVRAVKKKLDIHSPSRVMSDEVGKWIPRGIAVGIEKNQNPLKAAISGMASKIGYDSRSAMGVNGSKGGTISTSTTNNNSPVNVHLTYNGNDPQDGAKMVDKIERELQRRLGRKSFMRGATV
jgi:phage-related protein